MCELCGCGLIQPGERPGQVRAVSPTLGAILVAVIELPGEIEPRSTTKPTMTCVPGNPRNRVTECRYLRRGRKRVTEKTGHCDGTLRSA